MHNETRWKHWRVWKRYGSDWVQPVKWKGTKPWHRIKERKGGKKQRAQPALTTFQLFSNPHSWSQLTPLPWKRKSISRSSEWQSVCKITLGRGRELQRPNSTAYNSLPLHTSYLFWESIDNSTLLWFSLCRTNTSWESCLPHDRPRRDSCYLSNHSGFKGSQDKSLPMLLKKELFPSTAVNHWLTRAAKVQNELGGLCRANGDEIYLNKWRGIWELWCWIILHLFSVWFGIIFSMYQITFKKTTHRNNLTPGPHSSGVLTNILAYS